MKRILSLVLAMVMVLGSFSAVFAVEPTAADEAVEILMDLGVLTEGKLEQDLKRQDAIVLLSRLMGDQELAAEYPSEDLVFEDVIDPFYTGYVAWAVDNGLTKGKSATKFGFGEFLKTQELAMFLLRALGYGDVEFDNALTEATTLGLLVDVAEGVTAKRGMMAVMTLNALKTNYKGTEVTLATKLGHELPEEEVVVPAALEVKEVVANNLKEVKVTFNGAVDADTVTDSNISVKDNKGTVVLSEDGVTAVITLNAKLTNQKEYTLVVEKVKNVNELEIVKTEMKFKAFDATLPAVNSVDVTGPRNFTLTFSEPIDPAVVGKVEVKQDKAILGNRVTISGNKVNVEVFTNFAEGKEYSVTVSEFVDYAGYKNIMNTLTFNYEKDVTPPVATVEKVEQTYVVVSFDKPVKGLTKDKFYHTFSAWEAVNIYKDAGVTVVNSTDSVSKVYVYFYENNVNHKAIPAGSTLFGILGKEIKDNWGNALGSQEFTISATADRTNPEVKEIKVTDENKLKVTFTKDVSFEGKNVEILDADGKKIDGLYLTVTKVDNKEYDILLSKKLAGKTVTVSIKDVKDLTLAQNILSLHTALVEITDKTRPTVKEVYYNLKLTAGETEKYDNKSLYVRFSESVDPETALVAANYSLVIGDTVTILTGTPSFDSVDSKVIIPLTNAQAKAFSDALATVKLQVINVKDLAGNVITPVQIADRPTNVNATSAVTATAKATAKDTLVLKFNDLLRDVKADAFTVTVDTYGVGFTLTQIDSGTTTLEFKLEKGFNTNASGITLALAGDKGIKNSFGENVNALSITSFDDEVKPEVKVVAKKYVVAATETATAGLKSTLSVTIEFTEAMDNKTFSTRSFAVENGLVTDAVIAPNGTTVTLTVTGDTAAIGLGKTIRVSYVQDVEDAEGNTLNLDKGIFAEVKVD